MNGFKNYLELEKVRLNRKMFAYLDNISFLADPIFKENNLSVKVMNEWENSNNDYIVVIVSIKTKDIALFQKCMEELSKKMLILGNTDYEKEWKKLMKTLKE